MTGQDEGYLKIIHNSISVCRGYVPKLGSGAGVSVEEFQSIYGSDPFYRWPGLDDPLVYEAHRTAGGITAIYRQIGIGCERLIRRIFCDTLAVTDEDLAWSYEYEEGGKTQKRSLDAVLELGRIGDGGARKRLGDWMHQSARNTGVDQRICESLSGVVFEIRQGYKSKDSKRQNADIANASAAYTQSYMPCLMLMSTQIDRDVSERYRNGRWVILAGTAGAGIQEPTSSTFDFIHHITGYDLAGFFRRNQSALRDGTRSVLKGLLGRDK